MPVASILDKDRVRELILQGVPTKDIAAEQGVTVQAIRVFKCRALRADKAQALQSPKQVERESLDPRSERVRSAIAEEIERDLEVLKSKPAKTISGSQERQQLLSAITSTAKAVFGWGDVRDRVTVGIGLLQAAVDSARLINGKLTANQSEPIDIPSQITHEQRPAEPLSAPEPPVQPPPGART